MLIVFWIYGEVIPYHSCIPGLLVLHYWERINTCAQHEIEITATDYTTRCTKEKPRMRCVDENMGHFVHIWWQQKNCSIVDVPGAHKVSCPADLPSIATPSSQRCSECPSRAARPQTPYLKRTWPLVFLERNSCFHSSTCSGWFPSCQMTWSHWTSWNPSVNRRVWEESTVQTEHAGKRRATRTWRSEPSRGQKRI